MTIEARAARLEPFDLGTVPSGPLDPIKATQGLVLQYTPTIEESVTVEYESFSAPHTNEKFHIFKGRDNRKINLGNVMFTADTADNLRYMIAAIHFFRTYTMMDFGIGKSARPPAPMWFYAYGALGFERVPVLLSGYSLSFDGVTNDLVDAMDALASSGQINGQTANTLSPEDILRGSSGSDIINDLTGQRYTPSGRPIGEDEFGLQQPDNSESAGLDIVVPMKMEVSGLQLIVQHSPRFWKTQFDLNDFRSGAIMETREGASTVTPPSINTKTGPIPSEGTSVINQPDGIDASLNGDGEEFLMPTTIQRRLGTGGGGDFFGGGGGF